MSRKHPEWIRDMLSQNFRSAEAGRAVLYRITSPTNRQYIGATNDLVYRLSQHRYGYSAIGKSLRSHGLLAHRVEVLMVGSVEHVFETEKALIEASNTRSPHGLNLTEGGRRGGGHRKKGTSRSAESRMRQSAKMKGRACNATPESRKKQADSLQRFWSNPQNRENMMAARGIRAAA